MNHSQQQLPAAPAAERAILGGILLDHARYAECERLNANDFSLDSHRRIYAAIAALFAAGTPVDTITLMEELARRRELDRIGGAAYLASLTDGLPARPSLRQYACTVRDKAALRRAIHSAESLIRQASQPGATAREVEAQVTEISAALSEDAHGVFGIHDLADVPDVFAFDTAPVAYLAPEFLPRGALVLLSGEAGVGKSWLALALAVAVVRQGDFLGNRCEAVPALILDRENPLALVQTRLRLLGSVSCPGLRVWGRWVEDEPPPLGDPRLLSMARTYKPLMIFDSLVRFHTADENSATDMAPVMGCARKLADAGATVLLLHHRPKADGGSKYRGSSDILAAVDMAYALEPLEQGRLRLHRFKSRFSAETVLTLAADMRAGSFSLTDSPEQTQREDELAAISMFIAANPGATQNKVIEALNLGRGRGQQLLRSSQGKWWRTEPGPRGALLYFPIQASATCPPARP